jgi:mono/diheme cytochrome c family protein
MFRYLLLAAVAAISLTQSADACQRCGLFGRQCRFRAVHTEHVDHHYQYDNGRNADVFIVQANYQQPLVGQGATLYSGTGSYQSLVAPLVDPNLYFSQEMQLLKAAQETNALRADRTADLFQQALALHAPAVEATARAQAAKMVLSAAGLDPESAPHTSSQSLVIEKDHLGRLQIRTLTAEQSLAITQKIEKKFDDAAHQPPATLPSDAKYPLLTQYCAKCHGLDNAQPKGGLHLGDDQNVARAMEEKFFKLKRAVDPETGDMPPATAPQPSRSEREAILREIEAIVMAQRKGK